MIGDFLVCNCACLETNVSAKAACHGIFDVLFEYGAKFIVSTKQLILFFLPLYLPGLIIYLTYLISYNILVISYNISVY